MGFPVTFGALPGGPGVTQPLSLFDTQFSAVGQGLFVPCAAAGQNAVLLTPLANTPTQTGYQTLSPVYGYFAAQTNTGVTTVSIAGIGARNLYKGNGAVLVGANDQVAGNAYYIAFNPALNTGAGGFFLLNPAVAQGAGGQVQGTYKNLVCGTALAGAPSSQYFITADAICVSDGISNYFTALLVNVTASTGSVGANGLDAGSVAAGTTYYAFVIYNPTSQVVASLLSTSSTSPVLPAGFTMFARVGAAITDGSKNFFRILQKGNRAQFYVTPATNTAALINIAAGVAGSVTAPTYIAVALGGVVPPTARELIGLVFTLTGQTIILSPNPNYGHTTSPTNPPFLNFVSNGGASQLPSVDFSMQLESTNIYWASNSASGEIWVSGWLDNL